jgi:N-acetylmuramoyl-L-alanine amidase
MRPITQIIVHCSDTPDDLGIGVSEIRRYHVEKGWVDVGYHYVIRREGVLEEGRSIGLPGAHAKGHNARSVGICLVGRKRFTSQQMRSLVALVQSLMETFHLKPESVIGHYEVDRHGKTCPNIDMAEFRRRLAA